MPGIIGLTALVACIIFVIFFTFASYLALKKFSPHSKSTCLAASLCISVGIVAYISDMAFGEHAGMLSASQGEESLPELTAHGAVFIKGYEWTDGLSDGSFYKLHMSSEQFESFRKTSALRKVDGNLWSVIVIPDSLNDYEVHDCEDGQVYEIDYQLRAKLELKRYVDNFDFYVCPISEIVHVGSYRI